jgi:primosomal protein N' (replication factor Y)
VEQGYLTEAEVEVHRDPFLEAPVPADCPVTPSAEQAAALAAIGAALDSGSFSPLLLHGVTGSGKTEVYLRAIENAWKGRSALVLVRDRPDAAAGWALPEPLPGHGDRSVLHSGLSDGERYDAWLAIARGEAAIVIGARSALFAPLPAPGIIVVDEEHEASYKQAEGFRYHARDLALLRGQMAGGVVLLGSATPAGHLSPGRRPARLPPLASQVEGARPRGEGRPA